MSGRVGEGVRVGVGVAEASSGGSGVTVGLGGRVGPGVKVGIGVTVGPGVTVGAGVIVGLTAFKHAFVHKHRVPVRAARIQFDHVPFGITRHARIHAELRAIFHRLTDRAFQVIFTGAVAVNGAIHTDREPLTRRAAG